MTGDARQDICAVVRALEHGEPVMPLLWPEGENASDFSTIFLPFHAGSEGFLQHSNMIVPPLRRFADLSASIEGLLVGKCHPGYLESLIVDKCHGFPEPNPEVRQALLLRLRRFLAHLPDEATFRSWLHLK